MKHLRGSAVAKMAGLARDYLLMRRKFPPMSMNWSPPPAGHDESAREARTSKLLSVEISRGGGGRERVVVRNVSPHGIGARGDIRLIPCEEVVVHLPGGETRRAVVRWVRKDGFGLYIDEPIDPQSLQVRAASGAGITPRDAQIGFVPLQHKATPSRTGFQRSHRDQIIHGSSGWTRD